MLSAAKVILRPKVSLSSSVSLPIVKDVLIVRVTNTLALCCVTTLEKTLLAFTKCSSLWSSTLYNIYQSIIISTGIFGSTGGEVYTGFWWGNLKERDHLGDPGLDGRIILRWIFRQCDVGIWTGSSWSRIVTDGGHL